ncbi:MAG: helix-turn-helix transcriptional regulator [Clostridia bacterium]|nr:helix-turn-helix transcriptional regulator [Clostridia bacterium]
MDYAKLGARVRQQRVLNRLTQEQLAEKTGVSSSFIGHIERGEKKASVETVVALCNAMDISPSVLLQDSLTDAVMRSQLSFEKENQDLMEGLMHVLREHNQKQREY